LTGKGGSQRMPTNKTEQGASKCTYRRWLARTPQQQERLQSFRQRHLPRRVGNYLRFQHSTCGDGQA